LDHLSETLCLRVYTNRGAVMKQMSGLNNITGKTGKRTKLQFYS